MPSDPKFIYIHAFLDCSQQYRDALQADGPPRRQWRYKASWIAIKFLVGVGASAIVGLLIDWIANA